MAASDPAIALAHWRAVRELLFREHPQSPVPAAARATFQAHHFDHDPASASRSPSSPHHRRRRAPSPSSSPTAAPTTRPSRRVGRIAIPFASGARTLSVFWMAGYAGGLFIPFRDATNGTETYGAGRYLVDAAKSADLGGDPATGTLILDFNFAFQPSCAFDPRWACPLAPPENRLDIPIRAGERLGPLRSAPDRTKVPMRRGTLGALPGARRRAQDGTVRFLATPRRPVDERLLWSRDIRFVRRLATQVSGSRLLELETGMVLIGPADS